jgi:predicted O-linked N-acetylglucosamine transferase (SPINDLY family)
MNQYFELYSEIDIALDSFPHGGGTTTCDSLWMGVPVISRRGGTAVSRHGFSILSNVGLSEFVASNADEYVSIAATLAADRLRLATLRATLRERLRNSAVMDEPAFVRDFEQTLRAMRLKYCSQRFHA